MKKGTGFLTLFGGAVALYALLAAPVSMRAQETETIEDGVYIGNIYVGGMTRRQSGFSSTASAAGPITVGTTGCSQTII